MFLQFVIGPTGPLFIVNNLWIILDGFIPFNG